VSSCGFPCFSQGCSLPLESSVFVFSFFGAIFSIKLSKNDFFSVLFPCSVFPISDVVSVSQLFNSLCLFGAFCSSFLGIMFEIRSLKNHFFFSLFSHIFELVLFISELEKLLFIFGNHPSFMMLV
jgi:hypothetical protein